jgi:dCTP deaminase
VAFWSGETLLKYVDELEIVRPYDESKIDCSAYTLTLGPEAFVTPDFETSRRDHIAKRLEAAQKAEIGGTERVVPGGELVIPPGQFAYLLTEEFIRIPRCAMGFISLKFGVKGPGLINVSGFHVDPGFQGRLIFSVYNAGPSPIHLNRGQDVFLLWLAELDESSSPPFVKEWQRDAQTSISPKLISAADRPIHSLQQLSDKIEDLDGELKLFRRLTYGIAAILTFVFAVWRFAAPSVGVLANTFEANSSVVDRNTIQ